MDWTDAWTYGRSNKKLTEKKKEEKELVIMSMAKDVNPIYTIGDGGEADGGQGRRTRSLIKKSAQVPLFGPCSFPG